MHDSGLGSTAQSDPPTAVKVLGADRAIRTQLTKTVISTSHYLLQISYNSGSACDFPLRMPGEKVALLYWNGKRRRHVTTAVAWMAPVCVLDRHL